MKSSHPRHKLIKAPTGKPRSLISHSCMQGIQRPHRDLIASLPLLAQPGVVCPPNPEDLIQKSVLTLTLTLEPAVDVAAGVNA
jgi:hypothetical protein